MFPYEQFFLFFCACVCFFVFLLFFSHHCVVKHGVIYQSVAILWSMFCKLSIIDTAVENFMNHILFVSSKKC